MLGGLVATVFGALWVYSMEHRRSESARLYGSCMAYCYSTTFVVPLLRDAGLGLTWLALVGVLVVGCLIAMVVLGGSAFEARDSGHGR
jgi:hypothetical protein